MTAARTDAPEAGEARIPKELPVLPLRDLVVYPFIIVPLSVSRERSIKAVEKALSDNRMILLVAQKESDTEEPGEKDVHTVGTVGVIMRMLKLPDSRIRVLVQGVCRARVEGFNKNTPYLEAKIQRIHEPPAEGSLEVEALLRSTKKALERAVSLGKAISSEVMVIAGNLEEPGRLADLVASNLDLKVEDAQGLLKVIDPLARLRKTYELLNREIELLNMQQEINTHAREEIDKSQREYFLRQQLKAIQSELGEGNDLSEEVEAFREKAKKARMPKKVNDEVERQIGKLERMHPDSAETATLRNYLDWMVNLPWSAQTKDTLDLKKAQEILDADHYGLEGIKERIVEYLAVRKLKKKMRGPILCFVGPPGVGKTSLGRSIARALGRKFVRISLGGVRDEAEIRGHRRTYVGSMPGRIIQGISQAGSNNPVFMLDEVDKIGADYRGDPSAALLEVLDPEQNNSFRDHYLNVPFDLSNVMFVATANLLDPIQPAFRDRMEVITLSGYTEEEKVEIAKRHLIPKQIEENGLRPDQLALPDRSIHTVIQKYTREAGLRNLEREFAKMFRKLARRVAEGEAGPFNVTPKTAEGLLGVPRVTPEMTLQRDQVGVATGLAWTAAGGEILFVEATTMPGRGRLILTGHLGAVMKESAQAALSYARSRATDFGLNNNAFGELDVHVHVPEGAIPKDGPSAGITMATAILSVLTGRPVRRNIAMTGEITLRGNVLPIGGVKEKVLAARRAEASTVILPEANRRNLEDVPKLFRKGLHFVFVSDVNQVLAEALGEPIARPRTPRVAAGRSVAAL
ncbi:MAG TPA: endopeptidase La [Candidatus Polarisedimenticolia bacterium]|jgi:ATP-dependent Lon protease|nr:endopeptidase La [Candidatus Polarisedimenticolia bacterium]